MRAHVSRCETDHMTFAVFEPKAPVCSRDMCRWLSPARSPPLWSRARSRRRRNSPHSRPPSTSSTSTSRSPTPRETSSAASPPTISRCSRTASRRRSRRSRTSSCPSSGPTRFRFGGRPVPADVRSNRDVASGRVYIIVLDDLNVAPLRTAIVRRHAREFIERHFGPHDLAAVVVTSGRKDAAQEFTSDPALLLRAVDNFFGQRLQSAGDAAHRQLLSDQLALSGLDHARAHGKDPQDEAVVRICSRECSRSIRRNLERGQRAVGVLNTIAQPVGISRRRSGTPEGAAVVQRRHRLSDGRGVQLAERQRDHCRPRATPSPPPRSANVNVFALDPRGLIGMTTDFVDNMRAGAPDCHGHRSATGRSAHPSSGTQALLGEMRLTQDSLRTLADSTGGFAAVDTNSFAEAFSRIIDANSRYYLLGYAPPAHPRDGRFHRIEVRVKRPGLRVAARRGYPSPSGKTRGRAQAGSARAVGARPAHRRRERHVDRAARRAQQRRAAARADARPCRRSRSRARRRRRPSR